MSSRFGEFELDVTECRLKRAGVPVAVSPKAFDLLALLAEQPGKLRTKQELLDAIWPDTAVEEATLGRHISDRGSCSCRTAGACTTFARWMRTGQTSA